MKLIIILVLAVLAVTTTASLNGRFLVIGDIHYDSNYQANSDPCNFFHKKTKFFKFNFLKK